MRRFRLPVVLLLILLLALVALWAGRRPLSEAAVARWFTAQGVEARYRITALSPSALTLDAVSLGPVARPDFTAERIELTLGWSPLRPRVAAVRLVAPVLNATLGGDGLSFGSLDRLLPATARPREPFPDIDVAVTGGRLRLATPGGTLAGAVEGRGNLAGGFDGRWQVAPTALAFAGCTLPVSATVRLATAVRTLQVTAAGASARAACPGAVATVVDWTIAATLPQTLDRYAVDVAARVTEIAASGYRIRAVVLDASMSAPRLTGTVGGTARLRTGLVQGLQFRAAGTGFDGPVRFDPVTGDAAANGAVTLTGASTTLATPALRALSARFAGTLARPLYDTLLARADAAGRRFDARATVAVTRAATGPRVEASGIDAQAATGARLRQSGRVTLASEAVALNGSASLSGGGLPAATATGTASMKAGRITGRGTIDVAPWAVPGAALHAFHLDARGSDEGTTLAGTVRVSGALGGGVSVQRLGVPLALNLVPGRIAFGPRCLRVDWAKVSRDTLVTGPGAATLCPIGAALATLSSGRLGGGAVIAPLDLRGRFAGAPLALATGPLRVVLSGTTARPLVDIAPASITLTYAETRASATVGGRFDVAAAAGTGSIAAARVDTPGMPISVTAGSARWRLANARIDLAEGAARVTDRTAPARFEPLRIDGVSASIVNGVVDARGSARLAAGGARLAGFTARHVLDTARGEATVETGMLRFGPELQPYQITEALRGVVENVVGPVRGHGQLSWIGTAISSSGTLAVDHVSLATAALGPIDDVLGTVVFDDLLALTTPPGQRLTIKRINPGVAVEDGVARFRMLGPDAAAIETMAWPYAGGTLTLAPVVIRAGDTTRSFVLTVADLDAALFLQKFEIKNLNVTGRFDGRLPLVFADGRGRIAGGTLVAREGGGLVQYVGEIGGEDLGAGARLAFDALRRLRYRSLTLDLVGDLDGELVTNLRFSGTNEAATTLGGGPLPIRATGLPFRFNVTVRAPFRALLGTASSFSDVRPLIRPAADEVQPR